MLRSLTLSLALVLCAAAPALAQPARDPFDPLNLLLTEERLRQVHDQLALGDPLAVAARDQVVAEAAPFMARDPDPIHGVLKVPGFYTSKRAQQQAITRRLRGDAWGAHALALAFAVTGDLRYADRAERYLFAWVDHLTRPVDGGEWWHFLILQKRGDTPLVMSYSFPSFFYAYDLLRGLGRIDAAEHARFVAWVRPFVDYHRREELWKDNSHAWQSLFLATAAHVTQDRALFDQALRQYRRGFASQLCRDGALGRELLRGSRAATYTLMALEAMLQVVAIGERHGHTGLRDLRASSGARLVDTVDRVATFVVDPADWQRAYGLLLPSTVNGPASRSEWGWCFELAHALWGGSNHLSLAADAPYGLQPPRAYTLAFATLYFRPFPGLPSPLP
jgi:hypothetical protein